MFATSGNARRVRRSQASKCRTRWKQTFGFDFVHDVNDERPIVERTNYRSAILPSPAERAETIVQEFSAHLRGARGALAPAHLA